MDDNLPQGINLNGHVHLFVNEDVCDCSRCSLNEHCFELKAGSMGGMLSGRTGHFAQVGTLVKVIKTNSLLS